MKVRFIMHEGEKLLTQTAVKVECIFADTILDEMHTEVMLEVDVSSLSAVRVQLPESTVWSACEADHVGDGGWVVTSWEQEVPENG